MTAAHRMKAEMARADTTLTEGDKAELRRFAAYLADAHAGMPLIEQIEKHGADYLGFKPDEVAAIRARDAAAQPSGIDSEGGSHD